jgi:hypothetical protein
MTFANKKKVKKSKYDLYLSNECKDETKIVIKGNNLNCRWFGNTILIWSDKDIGDKLRLEKLYDFLESL